MELQHNLGKLAASEALYRALFTQDFDGILVINPDSATVTDANVQAGTILGYEPADLIGMSVEAFDLPGTEPLHEGIYQRLRAGEQVKEFGVELLRGDGTKAYVDLVASIVAYDNTRIVHAVFRDVSQRREMERAIAESNKQLRRISEAKSKFLAMTSHEIRTPLNAIVGFSELLEDTSYGELNEMQLDFAQNIREAARDLLALLGDVLDLSKVEAGRMKLELAPVSLARITEGIRKIVRGLARDTEVEMVVSVEPPDLTVLADDQRLKQILYNLLSNAIRYSPHGGKVEVRATQTGDMARVSVSDHGPGIAPEEQENIFEAYYRIPAEGEEQDAGTGLGLPLSRRLVEMHHGELTVESEVGQGSTFTFTIPIATQDA